jgi:RND family efflux transporter MFP subunit
MTAHRIAVHLGLLALLIGLVGCGKSDKAAKAELPPPMVTFAAPISRPVTVYEFATGRTTPLESVDIRARVSGELKAIYFEPGKEVAEGAKLFLIDPEPFQADRDKAQANKEVAEADKASADADLLRAQSRVATTEPEYKRQQMLIDQGVGVVAERDKAKGAFDEAVATERSSKAKVKQTQGKIEEAKAALKTADLNLGFCTIRSPITGIVGDKLVTVGNQITGGVGNATLLTTVVAVEQMDVAFDVDENTLQKVQAAVRAGKVKELAPGKIPAEAGLAVHGNEYPIKGIINFADNQFDTKTGTIRMKARFDNPKPPVGARLLSAGMFARLRVPIGEPVMSMLVPDSAFGSDQGVRFLYLLGPENKAIRWNANTGAQEGELRVVESIEIPGKEKPRPLSTSDQVIVTGIARLRPGMTVDPKPAAK